METTDSKSETKPPTFQERVSAKMMAGLDRELAEQAVRAQDDHDKKLAEAADAAAKDEKKTKAKA